MEAFETFVALALEEDGFIVSPAVKFPVRRQVRKAARAEYQGHGYEVDVVVQKVRAAAERKQYRDNAALVAVKVLVEAGQLVDLERTDASETAEKKAQ